MRIAIIVDSPYRDLPGLILVALRLCNEGATCYLVPMNLLWTELVGVKPDFVLVPHLKPDSEDWVGTLLNAGIRVGLLDTEGGYYSENGESSVENPETKGGASEFYKNLKAYAITIATKPEIRYQLSFFCSWGPQLARYASKVGWYKEEQIVVTGLPRYDLYASPWRAASLQMTEDYLKEMKDPFVLISSGFALANPRRKSPAQEKAAYLKHFSYTPDHVEDMAKKDWEGLHEFAALANTLAQRFPETSFVFRPHPFEKLDTYKPLLKPFPNLHLIRAGSVSGWLLRAKALIAWNDLTTIEANLLGVPALFPKWLKHYSVPFIEASSIPCVSKETLIGTLEDILKDRFEERPPETQKKFQRMFKEVFHKVDGYSHQRVASVILKSFSAAEGNHQLDVERLRHLLPNGDGSLRWRAASLVRRVFDLPPHWSLLRWKPWSEYRWLKFDKEKPFDVAMVRSWADALCEASQQDEKLRLRPVKVGLHRNRTRLPGCAWGRTVVLHPLER